jgi:hypothetical protein
MDGEIYSKGAMNSVMMADQGIQVFPVGEGWQQEKQVYEYHFEKYP